MKQRCERAHRQPGALRRVYTSVQARKAPALACETLVRPRRLPVRRAMFMGELPQAFQLRCQANLVGELQRPAARARETVTMHPDDVDVAGALRDGFPDDQ